MCVRLVQTNDVSFLLAGVIGLVLSGGAAALPGGDFNGDGFDDLAIGVPDEDVGLRVDAGAVHVLYGSVGGLRATIASGAPIDARLFTESATWWAGVSPQAGSRFGEALAIGDFNDDGFDDLAISAPGRDIVAVADAGRVYVVYGGHAGLGSGGSWIISEASYARAVGAGDRFGLSLASGDFDGDGADDLVIGAPLDDLDAADAGVAWLAYGAPGGLMLIPRRAPLHLVHWGMTPGPGEMFGWSLAVGNFDSDGYDDLIVGAPGFDRLGVVNCGQAFAFHGGPRGTEFGGIVLLTQSIFPGGDVEEVGDQLGWSVAAGDFDGNWADDVAIGAPLEDLGGIMNAGSVFVTGGIPGAGLTFGWHPDQSFEQDRFGLDGNEPDDQYGVAVITGDWNGDGCDDLVIGMPEQSIGAAVSAGVIHVLPGDLGFGPGLGAFPAFRWHQNTTGVLDVAESDDRFGAALGKGDYNGDGFDDLVVGVPGEDVGGVADCGCVQVFYGSAAGLSAAADQVWHQGSRGVRDANEAGDAFGSVIGFKRW